MSRRRKQYGTVALCAVAAIATGSALMPPAAANVEDYTQVVRQRQAAPDSGSYGPLWFRDVLVGSSQGTNCGHRTYAPGEGCWNFVRGGVYAKLRTYRVVEDMSADFFVFTADVDITHSTGTNGVGDFKLSVSSAGKVLEATDTAGKAAAAPTCTSVDLGISKTVGPFTAGARLGSARFCSEAAWLKRTSSSLTSANYTLHHFNEVTHVTLARVVKVSHNTTPSFKLNLAMKSDSCNKTFEAGAIYCYDAGTQLTKTVTYSIGTTPE